MRPRVIGKRSQTPSISDIRYRRVSESLSQLVSLSVSQSAMPLPLPLPLSFSQSIFSRISAGSFYQARGPSNLSGPTGLHNRRTSRSAPPTFPPRPDGGIFALRGIFFCLWSVSYCVCMHSQTASRLASSMQPRPGCLLQAASSMHAPPPGSILQATFFVQLPPGSILQAASSMQPPLGSIGNIPQAPSSRQPPPYSLLQTASSRKPPPGSLCFCTFVCFVFIYMCARVFWRCVIVLE